MSTAKSVVSETSPTRSTPVSTGLPTLLPSLSHSPLSDLEDFSTVVMRRASMNSNSDDSTDKARNSTAARRASHNAVERQRRDKLNARIMELASLLPNLSGVRRPSRIAITKSSIAHVHNSRKHRILAAQQLRALHVENEALRTEINQWRHRAGVHSVPEPRRDNAFMLVYNAAELELDPMDACEEEEYGEEPYYHPAAAAHPYGHGRALPHAYPYPQSQSPLEYGGSSPASSSGSGVPSPYSTPPASANDYVVPPPPYAAANFDTPHTHDPRIACPTPANPNPFEAQHFMLKTEDDEWAAAYSSSPPTHFQEQW
ncbi:hypothetical protein C8R46DRAFT_241314 [Mycena filopes]|nr:hypothetical protein C8R46DRAFT_241314 [Mycena filopes]